MDDELELPLDIRPDAAETGIALAYGAIAVAGEAADHTFTELLREHPCHARESQEKIKNHSI
jgi:hypothetical protein